MSRSRVKCDVCLDRFTLDNMRILPNCGHGFCIACTTRTQRNLNCAICRHPKEDKEPIQVFLTLLDPTNPVERAQSVTEGLGRIDEDAGSVSVQKAGAKIRQAVRHLKPEDAVARELLDAAKNLDERIAPVFTELKAQNALLANEVRELRDKLAVAQRQDEELQRLRQTLADTEQSQKKTAASAERRKAALAAEREEVTRLKGIIVQQESELAGKELEKDELRAKLGRRDNKVTVLEKKLKVMARQATSSSSTAKRRKSSENDPDESLQIEKSVRILRRSTDWEEGGVGLPPPKRHRP